MKINYQNFSSLKGELEAEGLTRQDIASEALFAARNGLGYLVKIGGAEAKSDINYLSDLGVDSVVCPMIETEFAMQKYMDMLSNHNFEHIGVTIETITAVENIEKILASGDKLTDVTIGRTDLTASWGGDSVESERTIEMVKNVALSTKRLGLKVTMGGSVSIRTLKILQEDKDLSKLIDFVETRKAVIPLSNFITANALNCAMELESILLERRIKVANRTLSICNNRIKALSSRNTA